MTATVNTSRGKRDDHSPPHDTAAEMAVLGCMLMSKDALGDAVEHVRRVDFYHPKHAEIFETIVALYNAGEPADAITVADRLGAAALDRIGGITYLHDCVSSPVTVASAGQYARIVAERALMRRMVEAGAQITALGLSDSDDPTLTLDRAQQVLFDVDSHRSGDGFELLEALLQPTLDQVEYAQQNGGLVTGVPTGFTDLDRLLHGLHPGQLIIVAGRPGLGKSTCGLDIVRAAAIKHRFPSAIFSLEMSKVEITMRLLSAEARVPLDVLRSGQLSDDDWSRLARRMGEIADAPIFVDDTPSMTLMEIRSKARRLKQRHDLKLIVVDYLQLLTPNQKLINPVDQITDLSRGLKLLSKEVECPVVAVSQLNRGPETRTDKRPALADLRGSGSIEQDADVVILLHRDDYYDKESPRAGEADFIVAKHRNGATDTVTVAAQLHLSRFVDMAFVP